MANCIYCDGPATRIKKGEHIVPEAIGGALTIREVSGRLVCSDCNNGVLSDLDQELSRRSFLAIVASQQIGGHLPQVWDVDESCGNLLVEARPIWKSGQLAGMAHWPQMIFDSEGSQLRGDWEEFQQIGAQGFQKVLLTAIRRAFVKYNRWMPKGIHLERIERDARVRKCRLPPRLYAPRSIWDIHQNINRQSFILRYDSSDSLQFALRCLSRLNVDSDFDNWQRTTTSSRLPTMGHFFDLLVVIRAFAKLGLNILAAYCSKTPISPESFGYATQVVLGLRPVDVTQVEINGFVCAADIQNLRHDDTSHMFRLVHLDGLWIAYFSFFGAKIGAVVSFPGPNSEDWNTIDIVAPLRLKDWEVKYQKIINPIRTHVEWRDMSKIAPTLDVRNPATNIEQELVRRRSKRGTPKS